MMHKQRAHSVRVVESLAELVLLLTEQTWTTCSGFAWGSLLLLNDSTCEDGAQEYAVVRHRRQVESLTISWMTRVRLQLVLTQCESGALDSDMGSVVSRPHPRGTCEACA